MQSRYTQMYLQRKDMPTQHQHTLHHRCVNTEPSITPNHLPASEHPSEVLESGCSAEAVSGAHRRFFFSALRARRFFSFSFSLSPSFICIHAGTAAAEASPAKNLATAASLTTSTCFRVAVFTPLYFCRPVLGTETAQFDVLTQQPALRSSDARAHPDEESLCTGLQELAAVF